MFFQTVKKPRRVCARKRKGNRNHFPRRRVRRGKSAIDGQETHASDSQPFRRFLPFSPWWATAHLRPKEQKSLENTRLSDALQFCRRGNALQARKRPQRILCVFSRALTPIEGISARQNRMFSCLSMASSARKRASVSECAAASRPLLQTKAQSGVRIRKLSVSPKNFLPEQGAFSQRCFVQRKKTQRSSGGKGSANGL